MVQLLRKILVPVWWDEYEPSFLKWDMIAGFTIGVMLIPQGMAYAMLAGMPPIYGLYASAIPTLIYVWLGSSRRLAVGPAAITCIILGSAAAGLAEPQTPEYINIIALTSILTGLVYITLLLLRLAKLVDLLQDPVNKGFAASGGLIIFFNQLKYLFGLDIKRSSNILEILERLVAEISNANWITFAIGVVGIILLYKVPKWKKTFPIALIVIIASVLLVWGLGLEQSGVAIIGTVPQGLPNLVQIEWDWNLILKLLPNAIMICLVGFTVSISIAKIVAQKNGLNDVRPRRELMVLGLANIISGMFGSIVVNGSMSRTMVNDQVGAKSGLSLLVSSILIFLTLLFLTPVFYYLPTAILASVIIVAISRLIKVQDAIDFYKSSKWDFATYCVTFIAVLTISIEMGIIIGVVFYQIIKFFKNRNESPA